MKQYSKITAKQLQNHLNNSYDASEKNAYSAKRYYKQGDRVHLKGTAVNGEITGVVFKEDRKYPYLRIKWDTAVENEKKYYDPFDITLESIKPKIITKAKKPYINHYLESKKGE